VAEWLIFIAGAVLALVILRGLQWGGARFATRWGKGIRLSICVGAGLLIGLVLPVLGRAHWLWVFPIIGVGLGAYTGVLPYPRPPIGRRLAFVGSFLGGVLLGRGLAAVVHVLE